MNYTDFYCDPVNGSNLNGGGINGGAEPTAAASYTSVSGNWDGTSVFTPADGSTPASTVNVGDFASVYVTGGAAPTGYIARVTAVGAGVNGTITLSTTAKSGAVLGAQTGTGTIKVGGRWQGPNANSSFPFNFLTNTATNSSANGPRVNLKNNGTYSVTASLSANKAGVAIQGYTTTAGDGGRATIDGGTAGASYTLLSISQSIFAADLVVQNNGATGSATGINLSNLDIMLFRVTVNSVRGHGINANGAAGMLVECEAWGCNQSNTAALAGIAQTSSAGGTCVNCCSHDNTGSNSLGFFTANNTDVAFVGCIADSNGLHGFQITTTSTAAAVLQNCDAYNNGGDGVNVPSTNVAGVKLLAANSNLCKNAGYGINLSGGPRAGYIYNCGFGTGADANTSGNTNALDGVSITGTVTYTSPTNPWNAPATGDFTITAAAAKSAGRGAFTETGNAKTGTVGHPDIGAGQALIAGGGGLLVNPGMTGGMRG